MTKDKTGANEGLQSVDNSPSEKKGRYRSIFIPTRDADGVPYELTSEHIEGLVGLYPTVEVPKFLEHMVNKVKAGKIERPTKNRQGARTAVNRWLDMELRFQRTGSRRFVKRAPKEAPPWFATTAGWMQKGVELGVVMEQGEAFVRFRARVCVALGDGPWANANDWSLMRAIEELRGDTQALSPDQARERLARMRQMGFMKSGSVH